MPAQPRTKRTRAPRAEVPQLRSMSVAAEFLDINPRTVRRMVAAGELRAYRIRGSVKVDMNEVRALAQPVPPESVSA